jgi:hypothetical protein
MHLGIQNPHNASDSKDENDLEESSANNALLQQYPIDLVS